ncbi:hypothetical protein cyc_03176 [Cyclospora cayetanensis]|uniref:Uncharacterized protein n=1 Tax=Cyclospora cayetanensis TaxID=88456 RepID=A0A1D3D9M5_9EIME|nr:hypothetical protein cyc_03176 [Cyclospora cayetanensis]
MASQQENQHCTGSNALVLEEPSSLAANKKHSGEVPELQSELERQTGIIGRYSLQGEEDGGTFSILRANNTTQERLLAAAANEGDVGDSDCLAEGGFAVEESPDGVTTHNSPNAVAPSSAIFWALPIAPFTPREDAGTPEKLTDAGTTAPDDPPNLHRCLRKWGIRKEPEGANYEGTQREEVEEAAITGFLQQFQEILPPETAADCVVCALRPVHPVSSEELLQQGSKQQRLFEMLEESRSIARSYECRLVQAEGERSERETCSKTCTRPFSSFMSSKSLSSTEKAYKQASLCVQACSSSGLPEKPLKSEIEKPSVVATGERKDSNTPSSLMDLEGACPWKQELQRLRSLHINQIQAKEGGLENMGSRLQKLPMEGAEGARLRARTAHTPRLWQFTLRGREGDTKFRNPQKAGGYQPPRSSLEDLGLPQERARSIFPRIPPLTASLSEREAVVGSPLLCAHHEKGNSKQAGVAVLERSPDNDKEEGGTIIEERAEQKRSIPSLRLDGNGSGCRAPQACDSLGIRCPESALCVPETPRGYLIGKKPAWYRARNYSQLPHSLNIQLESMGQQVLAQGEQNLTRCLERQWRATKQTASPLEAAPSVGKKSDLQVEQQPQRESEKALIFRTSSAPASARFPTPMNSLTAISTHLIATHAPAEGSELRTKDGEGRQGALQTACKLDDSCESSRTRSASAQLKHEAQEDRNSHRSQKYRGKKTEEDFQESLRLTGEQTAVVRLADPRKEERSQRKMVRWKGRSSSCSFPSERATTHRLLYLMPGGETLHPRKLRQMMQGDKLVHRQLQLTIDEGQPTLCYNAEEEQRQQSSCMGMGKCNNQEGVPKCLDMSLEISKGAPPEAVRGAEAQELPAMPEKIDVPSTPVFPHSMESQSDTTHAKWNHGDTKSTARQRQQIEEQLQSKRPHDHPQFGALAHQQGRSPQPAETCWLKPALANPHCSPLPLAAPLSHHLQPQKQTVPWLADIPQLARGFCVARSPQIQTAESKSCPLALQKLTAFSPRPVLLFYASQCQIQQQAAQGPQAEVYFPDVCKLPKCCHDTNSETSKTAIAEAPLLGAQNGESYYCKAVDGCSPGGTSALESWPKDKLHPGRSEQSKTGISDASQTKSWCVLCENKAELLRPLGAAVGTALSSSILQDGARSCVPPEKTQQRTDDPHEPQSHNEINLFNRPMSDATQPSYQKHQQNPSQLVDASPGEILPLQQSTDPGSPTNPQEQGVVGSLLPRKATTKAAASPHTIQKGSLGTWIKPSCFYMHGREPEVKDQPSSPEQPAAVTSEDCCEEGHREAQHAQRAPKIHKGHQLHQQKPQDSQQHQGEQEQPQKQRKHQMQQASKKHCHQKQVQHTQWHLPSPSLQRSQSVAPVPAAVPAMRASLLHSQGGPPLLAVEKHRGPCGSAVALQSQSVRHKNGVDYVTPAVGDNATFSSISSLDSLKNACKPEHELLFPLQQQRQHGGGIFAESYPPSRTHVFALLRHENADVVRQPGPRTAHLPPASTRAVQVLQCDTQHSADAATNGAPQASKTALAQTPHQQLELQILELQQQQTQLHQQQHAQYRRLLQQQRTFLQQQRLFQQQQEQRRHRDVARGSHQRSATPQAQQCHWQVASIPVPYVDMGRQPGSLMYMHVQESPRWFSNCQYQQEVPRCTPPSLNGNATAAPVNPVTMRAGFLEPLTPRASTNRTDGGVVALGPAAETLPTPVAPLLAGPPCVLLPVQPASITPVLAPQFAGTAVSQRTAEPSLSPRTPADQQLPPKLLYRR